VKTNFAARIDDSRGFVCLFGGGIGESGGRRERKDVE